MSRSTAIASLVSFARPVTRCLALGLALLWAGAATAQTVGEISLQEVGFADWSQIESDSDQKPGKLVEPPPPERFLPESDCPIVEGEPRCVYVVHHDRHSWAAWIDPTGGAHPTGYESHLRVDARNFSGRPAEARVLAFDTNGGFRHRGPLALASGRSASLLNDATALETVVIVSDTRLRLSAHVESRRRIELPPSPIDFCFPGVNGERDCTVTPSVIFEPIGSHHAPIAEVDCEPGRGDEFLCQALRYLP